MLAAALLPRVIDRQAGLGAFRIGREHYDLGNDLFEVMLDRSMTYTSGYWAEAGDLHEAQSAKLELLCRKLELEPGMRVLDIGCGWGNFARHAAAHHLRHPPIASAPKKGGLRFAGRHAAQQCSKKRF